jgi:hypothetical protein
MMMEALRSTETFVLTRASRRNIPEDPILQSSIKFLKTLALVKASARILSLGLVLVSIAFKQLNIGAKYYQHTQTHTHTQQMFWTRLEQIRHKMFSRQYNEMLRIIPSVVHTARAHSQ